MAPRPPSAPPALPGFDYVKLLGKGGFADVFLYRQNHPRRQVAVKVLLKDRIGTTTAEGFTEEANLMAQFVTHPSIVSVYQAGIADDGRPYLVMEYCSKPNLQARHRKERFSEGETLRVGVQIAGAVETAHRAGILHRDIKPANILVNDYGRPTLTDFGISATVSGTMAGVSIPWAPPESLVSPPQGYPSSDVYSLAATLFTLLTNRTPFEIPGASNADVDVIGRIRTMPLPTTGRADVSAAFQQVLEKAMAKDPAQRYASAIEFARALQRVQIAQHGMQETPLDVLEEELVDVEEDDGEERTRFRNVTNIEAQATPPARATAPLPATAPASVAPAQREETAAGVLDATVIRGGGTVSDTAPTPASIGPAPAAPRLDSTIVRESPLPIETDAAPVVRRRGRAAAIVVAAVVLVAAGVGVAFVLSPDGVGEPGDDATPQVAPVDAVGETGAPQVDDLTGRVFGDEVTFTWTNPDPADGDVYLWRPVVPGEEFTFEETSSESVTVPVADAGQTCIEVVLRRADGTSAATGVEGCAS